MKSKRDYRDSLDDILNAIKDIENFVKDMDFTAIINSREKLFATVFSYR